MTDAVLTTLDEAGERAAASGLQFRRGARDEADVQWRRSVYRREDNRVVDTVLVPPYDAEEGKLRIPRSGWKGWGATGASPRK